MGNATKVMKYLFKGHADICCHVCKKTITKNKNNNKKKKKKERQFNACISFVEGMSKIFNFLYFE